MKIIQTTSPQKSSSMILESSASAPDLGRMEALEKIARSILERLQTLEDRLETLEKMPKPAPAAEPPPDNPQPRALSSEPILDSEIVKKDLLVKMWKYLNDLPPSKTA